jgi:hypothetical protein
LSWSHDGSARSRPPTPGSVNARSAIRNQTGIASEIASTEIASAGVERSRVYLVEIPRSPEIGSHTAEIDQADLDYAVAASRASALPVGGPTLLPEDAPKWARLGP